MARMCVNLWVFILLNLLGQQYGAKNIGLYTDDEQSAFKNCSSPHCVKSVRIRSYSGPHFSAFGLNTDRYGASLRIQSEYEKMRTRITPNTDTFYAVSQMEKIKKHLQKVFKNNSLDVIIECKMETVNYFDVTVNLNDGTYRPYQKPDNISQYIHVESNPPPNIIKQIPKTVEKRLSQLSSNEEIFNESVPFYEDKLHQLGYQQNLNYNPVNTKIHNKSNHKRSII